MSKETKYMYATIVLAILTIVFASLYFTKTTPTTVTENLDKTSEGIQTCNANIAAWKVQYGVNATSSEARGKLDGILSLCSSAIQEASDRI